MIAGRGDWRRGGPFSRFLGFDLIPVDDYYIDVLAPRIVSSSHGEVPNKGPAIWASLEEDCYHI